MALASEDQTNIDVTGLTLDRFMAMFFRKEEPDPP
jgi:hypothetical protein